jgi:hypothetical protein
MLEVKDLKIGHRYLFLGQHVDTDDFYEGVLEENSAKGEYTKLRFEDGTHSWRKTGELHALEELPIRSVVIEKAREVLEEAERKHAAAG